MGNAPLLLSPASKDYLWGGSRLNDDFGKDIDCFPLAETWECSTHPDGESKVNGRTLSRVLSEHPEYMGTHPLQITDGRAELPILVKLIDAKQNLSVQVHPDDDYAKRVEKDRGKTEMWYVLDARSDSRIVYGFNQKVSARQIRDAIHNGVIGYFLNTIPVHKNDVFFIEPGTVHAIGKGCLVAEIQQSSNLTYRLYDYDRVDRNGNRRPLHVEKALDVLDYDDAMAVRQPLRVLKYRKGYASELLVRCKYFQVERMLLNTEIHRKMADFRTNESSFHVLLCVDGCGSISGDGYMQNFFKGDCIFVPANSIPLKLHGMAQLLDISC